VKISPLVKYSVGIRSPRSHLGQAVWTQSLEDAKATIANESTKKQRDSETLGHSALGIVIPLVRPSYFRLAVRASPAGNLSPAMCQHPDCTRYYCFYEWHSDVLCSSLRLHEHTVQYMEMYFQTFSYSDKVVAYTNAESP
jgi:hypothetical protein